MASEERLVGKVGRRSNLLIMQENHGIVSPYATKRWDDDAYDEALAHHGKLEIVKALNRVTKIDDRTKAAGKKGKHADEIRKEVTIRWAADDPVGLAEAKKTCDFDTTPNIPAWNKAVDARLKALNGPEISEILVKVGMFDPPTETTETPETPQPDDPDDDPDDDDENGN